MDAGVRVRIERPGSAQAVLEAHCELAVTAEERRQGLRGSDPLLPGQALLMVLPRELEVCIVNDGVTFSIDAIYARNSGSVLAIERDIPANDGTARCHEGVRWIVETAAGEAAEVAAGDELVIEPNLFLPASPASGIAGHKKP